MSYIYLASPYTDPNPSVQEARFYEVCKCAAYFIKQGYYIFSPIAHCHPIAMAGELPKHFTYWETYDRIMIRNASEFWVLALTGWRNSEGIKRELTFARTLNLEIHHVIPNFEKETYKIETPYLGEKDETI